MTFSFVSPVTLIFGSGSLARIFSVLPETTERALIVSGSRQEGVQRLQTILEEKNIITRILRQSGEPTVDQAAAGAEKARKFKADLVIGMGGGSVMDLAKAVSALATASRPVLDYLEVIGNGMALESIPLPLIAIPTTSGTGAEATANAVLASPKHGVKVSMRSSMMYPTAAVIDPELTLSLPKELTAATGMDALTQLLEAFVSKFSGPITDALCREGLNRAARSLIAAVENPSDLDAREDMSLAALLSGISLANAKLGAVHGIAGPLGGMVPISHGTLCAHYLAPVMEMNIRCLIAEDPDGKAMKRYTEAAQILTGSTAAGPMEGPAQVRDIVQRCGLPLPRALNLPGRSRSILAKNALKASSMKGNPVSLTLKQVRGIIDRVSDTSLELPFS